MKLWLVALGLFSSAASFGISQFTADAIKLKTILEDARVAAAFPRGIDRISKTSTGGGIISYAFLSGACELEVKIRHTGDTASITPTYEVVSVGRVSNCP